MDVGSPLVLQVWAFVQDRHLLRVLQSWLFGVPASLAVVKGAQCEHCRQQAGSFMAGPPGVGTVSSTWRDRAGS